MSLDLEPVLAKSNNGHLCGGVSNVHESNMHRISLWKVRLVDSICQSGGGVLVNQTKAVKSSDRCCVEHCVSLRLCEVGWHRDRAICDYNASLLLSILLQVHKNHGHKLFWAEGVTLVAVHNVH
mmetsp:Transcript_37740/g.84116  ORF Transcript_37740/g.84116 Transcript_37740/m.84116 type:complete len:124 (-) Transcript_37740:401-772(-)